MDHIHAHDGYVLKHVDCYSIKNYSKSISLDNFEFHLNRRVYINAVVQEKYNLTLLIAMLIASHRQYYQVSLYSKIIVNYLFSKLQPIAML